MAIHYVMNKQNKIIRKEEEKNARNDFKISSTMTARAFNIILFRSVKRQVETLG